MNPVTLGLITGGASFLGGAIGSKASGGKLTGGKFFQASRKEAQKELGAFGTQNLMSALRSGITAGIGQKLKLMKADKEGAKLSEGFGMDFEGSFVGKGLEKRGAEASAIQLTKARSLQTGEGMTTVVGDSTGVGTGTYTGKGSDIPSLSDLYEEELGLSRITKPAQDPSLSPLLKPALDPKIYKTSAYTPSSEFGDFTRGSMGFGGYSPQRSWQKKLGLE